MDVSPRDSDFDDLQHSDVAHSSTSSTAVDLEQGTSLLLATTEVLDTQSHIANSDDQSDAAATQDTDSVTIIDSTQPTSSFTVLQHPSTSDSQTASNKETFDTFHPFRRLPIELRLAVWKLASPAPATLEVTAYFDDREDAPLPCWFEPIKRSTTLLRTCHESREAYITELPSTLPILMTDDWDAHMTAWWTDSRNWTSATNWSECVMRFGPKDTIHFDNPAELFWMPSFWSTIKEQDWAKEIKTLEIDSDDYGVFITADDWVTMFAHFTGLQRIEIQEVKKNFDLHDLTEQVWKEDWKKMKSSILAQEIDGLIVPEMVWFGIKLEDGDSVSRQVGT
ncbi:uncharacterized protein PAC_11629 [Phialocephala subalpina]|uniref:2EXR domain-containing protein n=1 Tax=Phialocephala subalpina TaxID=576137 RepID=A0A1L7X9P3_9HELO|nr:uncharacterized protein PAC_11629 [Phialocephala subalpina]